MKFKISEIVLIFLIVLSILSFRQPVSGDLVINLKNVKTLEGMIWLALYDSEENLFVKDKSILKGIKVEETGELTGKLTVKMDQVLFGTYALAIYHDINNDGKLNQNILGIPTEPYAFARKPKSKWRAPRYKELTFDFSETNQEITTKLGTWWEQ